MDKMDKVDDWKEELNPETLPKVKLLFGEIKQNLKELEEYFYSDSEIKYPLYVFESTLIPYLKGVLTGLVLWKANQGKVSKKIDEIMKL